MIGIRVHETRHCAHTPPPNPNTTHCLQPPQVLEHAVHIIPLVVAEGDVLALGESAACEIEGEDSHVPTEQVVGESCAGWESEYPSSLQLALAWR